MYSDLPPIYYELISLNIIFHDFKYLLIEECIVTGTSSYYRIVACSTIDTLDCANADVSTLW